MQWIVIALLCTGVATILGSLFTWLARRYAGLLGLVDKPKSEGHKNHRQATPVAGGAAMWCAWILTVIMGYATAELGQGHIPAAIAQAIQGLSSVATRLTIFALCATVLMLAGIYDDRFAMKAWSKFLIQFAVAFLTACMGSQMLAAYCPQWLAIVLATLWIVTVINAINFFDNMDGLAGGTGAIALLFLLIVSLLRGQYFVAMLHSAALGAVVGFLFFNRHPASIFMGDSGSHFLGYIIACGSLLTTYYIPQHTPTLAALMIPPLILAVPLLDAVIVVAIRMYLGKPIYVGDNRHLSHRFTAMGISRPLAVRLIWLLSLISGTGALTLLWLPPAGVTLIILQVMALMATILIIQLQANHPNP